MESGHVTKIHGSKFRNLKKKRKKKTEGQTSKMYVQI